VGKHNYDVGLDNNKGIRMASCNIDIFARRSSRDRLYFYLHVERKLFVNIFMVYLF
jgi:hypothetical protein